MTYVIRSMTTTDWNGRDPVTPYHIYLMRPEHRRGAYWTPYGTEIMTFDTLEAAEDEYRRLWPEGRQGRTDIAPRGHSVSVWEEIHHQPE